VVQKMPKQKRKTLFFLCAFVFQNAKTKAQNTSFVPLWFKKRQNKSTKHFLCAFVVQKMLKQKHRTLPFYTFLVQKNHPSR
jgi:hypothetical protein